MALKTLFRRRKAISPILATVILIAITLVAGVAIAGFAFGLFGTLGSSANVSVSAGTVCYIAASGSFTANTCYMSVSNSGTAAGSLTACSIGTNTVTPAVTTIPAGGTVAVTCTGFSPTLTALGATAGQSLSGTITINGNLVTWAGTYGP